MTDVTRRDVIKSTAAVVAVTALPIPAPASDFEHWIILLKKEFSMRGGMTALEASRMVDGCGLDCWRESYDDGMMPEEAALTEMSYWETE